jgi:hypothetical protein
VVGAAVGTVARWLRGHRSVLVGAGAVLAVLVGGFAVVLASGGRAGSEATGASSAPAAPAPGVGLDAMTESAPSGKSAPGLRADAGGSGAQPAQDLPGGVERQLVRTAQLTVEVGDPATSVRQVRTAAAAVGGMVTEEQSDGTGSRMVLRVPADALDRTIDGIAGYGRVTARSTQVLDATEQVVDLDARVASQQASVTRVRALLAQANTIGEVVAVESELANREADLESLTRRLESLRGQVAQSTLTVDLRGPGAPPPAAGPTPGFLDGLATGWDGLRALGSGVAAVIGFVLPFLPVIAVLVGIGWLARRIVRGRRAPASPNATPESS